MHGSTLLRNAESLRAARVKIVSTYSIIGEAWSRQPSMNSAALLRRADSGWRFRQRAAWMVPSSGEVRCGSGAGQDWVQKMSTQRRASRTFAAIEMDRAGVRHRWFLISGITAPLMSIFWLMWAWLFSGDKRLPITTTREATDSLLSDRHNETLALVNSRTVSLPGGVGIRGPSALRVTLRSSLSYDSLLPVRTHLHTTLPIAPVTRQGGRWAERHDGKRDLYFQHAA